MVRLLAVVHHESFNPMVTDGMLNASPYYEYAEVKKPTKKEGVKLLRAWIRRRKACMDNYCHHFSYITEWHPRKKSELENVEKLG